MNLSEIIRHRIIIETQPSIEEPPHVVAYDYERAFLDGTLEAIAFHPVDAVTPDNISIARKNEDLDITQGAELLIPMVILYHVLSVRLNIPCDHPHLLFKANNLMPLQDIRSEHLETFLMDIRAINMHNVELTNGFYKRFIEPMNDNQCVTLYQTLNTISL